MEKSFREQRRRMREKAAFQNLYAYARKTKIPDPKRTAERTARQLHGNGPAIQQPTGATQQEDKVPRSLDDRTKEQLYARAQELDIEGRSQMNKEELIAAIRGK
ncbi:hypothetical protein BH23GEM6_BH23GEM6_06990 [soil metagenome]